MSVDISEKEPTFIIKKPSAMIQINVKELSLLQRKILNFFIYMIQNQEDKEVYHINLSVLKKLCVCGDTSNQMVKLQLEKLPSVVMKYNYLNKDNNEVWECLSLLPWINVDFGTGIIKYKLANNLKKNILYPNIYTPINIIMVASLKSKYSIILYELLRDYIDSPQIPILSIEKLKDLMGINSNQYNEFKNLKRLVINVAIKEINEKADIKCSCTYIKHLSKKYTHIKFHAVRKESIPEILKEMEHIAQSLDEVMIFPDDTKELKELPIKDICCIISNNLKIREETISLLLKNYGEARIKEVYEQTLKSEPENPAGFFLKALENNYVFSPCCENSEKIKAFKIESSSCYKGPGYRGNCGSTWKTALEERNSKACYWCQKYKEEREKEKNNN